MKIYGACLSLVDTNGHDKVRSYLEVEASATQLIHNTLYFFCGISSVSLNSIAKF